MSVDNHRVLQTSVLLNDDAAKKRENLKKANEILNVSSAPQSFGLLRRNSAQISHTLVYPVIL